MRSVVPTGSTFVERLQHFEHQVMLCARPCPSITFEQLEDAYFKKSNEPKSFSQALRLAADVQEKLEVAQLKIEVDAPKVQFAEVVSDSSNTRCIRIWVKAMKHENNLTVGEQQVFKWLLDNRYIFKDGGGYLPYSKYEANGTNYFTVVIDEINGKPRRALKITGKGVVALTGKVVSHFNPPRNGLVLLGEPA